MEGKVSRIGYPQFAFFKLAILILFFQVFQLQSQDFITGYGASAWNLSNKQVVHVTNLNDSGPGSFREALSGTDRIILFDVGGIIELSSTLRVLSNTVVAAFTAPGDYGIICKGASMQISGNNVAVVGLKLWLDAFSGDSDALQVNRSSNVLIAYGSYLFGTDECLSTYAGGTTSEITMDDVTFFGNLAVGANNNHHAAGGMMNGKGVNNVDFIQCVAAFNQIRNFRFAGSVSGAQQRGNQYNCVSYNWLNQASESSGTPDVNVIGNYFKRGPRNGNKSGIHNEGGRIYIADNNTDQTTGGSGWTQMSTPHSTPYTYNFLSADAAYDKLVVNKGVGWKNSPIEEAILNHIANGTMPAAAGSNDGIEAISQLGGWPSIPQSSTTHTYSDIEPYLLSFFDGSQPPPPPNNAIPFINPISSYPLDVNEVLGPVDFTIGDNETPADQLVVTASSDDQSIVRSSNIVLGGSGTTRTFTITPETDAVGTVGITLTVSDGEDQSSESFGVTVSVNEPPTISSISDQSIEQNQTLGPITFTVGDDKTSVDDINVSATSSNQPLVENVDLTLGGSGANRTITLTPNTNAMGTATITVTAFDGPNQTSESFLLTVTQATNQAPAISDISNQTVEQGEIVGPLNFSVRDTELPSTSLVVTVSSDNQSVVADQDITLEGNDINRTITITPNPNSFGTAIITLTVSDGELSTSEAFRVTVNDPPNTPPTITQFSDQVIDQGTSLGPQSFTVQDAESSANELTVSATSSNQTLVRDNQITITGTGATRDLEVTPDVNEFGTAVITIQVSDGEDQSSTTFTLTVNQVVSGNTTPSISSIPDQTIDEDQSTGAIDFTIDDAESSAGSLTLSGSSDNPTLVSVNDIVFEGSGQNRTVTVTPNAGEFGTANITVTVSDGISQSTTTFTLTVNQVVSGNTTPNISSIPDQTIDEDQSTDAIDFTIDDAESGPGTLTLSGSSTNQSLVSRENIVFGGGGRNRTVTVTPEVGAFGTCNITLTVSDGISSSVETFALSVMEAEQQEITFSITVQDADCADNNGSIDLSVSGGSAPYTYSWSNGASSPNIDNLSSGVYTIEVTDDMDNSRTASFVVGNVPGEGAFDVNAEITNESCNGSDGAISLLLGEGYTCQWSNGATTEAIQGLEVGTYEVTVTNATGCYVQTSFTVEMEDGPEKPLIQLSENTLSSTAAGGYEWYLDGNLLEDATGQQLVAVQSGDYHLTVIDENGCSASSDIVNVAIEDPFESDTDIAGLEIYPNPATTAVNIELLMNTTSNDVVLGISTLQGAPVLRERLKDVSSSLDQSLDVSNLTPGVYLVRIKVNAERVVKRLIVQ